MSRWANWRIADVVRRKVHRHAQATNRRAPSLWIDTKGTWVLGATGCYESPRERQDPTHRPTMAAVSEHLLVHLHIDTALPLARGAATEAYARRLFEHYYGPAAQRWTLAQWALRSGRGRGVVGLTQPAAGTSEGGIVPHAAWPASMATLHALARRHPAWAGAPDAALAWVEGTLVTVLRLASGRIVSIRHHRLPDTTGTHLAETIAAALTPRETSASPTIDRQVLLLGYGLDAPTVPLPPSIEQLGTLNGTAPDPQWFEVPRSRRWPAPDLAARRHDARHRGRLAWTAAVAGVAMIVALFAEGGREEMAPAPDAAASRVSNDGSATDTYSGAILPTSLAYRWDQAFSDIERHTPPGIVWLGMTQEAASGTVRLEGQAQDRLLPFTLANALSERARWNAVVVNRLQPAANSSHMHFELTATVPSKPTGTDAIRLPAAGGRHERLARFLSLVAGADASVGDIEQRLTTDRQAATERLQLGIPVNGTYAALRSLVEEALLGDEALSLDRVTLFRSAPTDPRWSAQFMWSFHGTAGGTSAPTASHRPARQRSPWAAPDDSSLAAWQGSLTPPPEPAPSVAAIPPPAPSPPPVFPYQWIGQVRQAEGVHALLSRDGDTNVVKAGDRLEDQWQIESIADDRLTVRWLPAGHVQAVGAMAQ